MVTRPSDLVRFFMLIDGIISTYICLLVEEKCGLLWNKQDNLFFGSGGRILAKSLHVASFFAWLLIGFIDGFGIACKIVYGVDVALVSIVLVEVLWFENRITQVRPFNYLALVEAHSMIVPHFRPYPVLHCTYCADFPSLFTGISLN